MKLAESLYLRPGELFGLRVRQLIPPAPLAGMPTWGVMLHPFEDAVASKTLEFDDTLALDSRLHPYLPDLIARVKVKLPADDFLVNMLPADFNRVFTDICNELGLQRLHPVPYMLRHAGASLDLAMQARTLGKVKRRGRWKADASLKRYAKGGRLAEQWDRLGLNVQRMCSDLHMRIGGILGKPLAR